MTMKDDKITTEGGPTLFDPVQPQETPETGQGGAPQALNATADVFGNLDEFPTGDTWQPQATKTDEPDEWADIMQLVAEVRRDAERAGVWVLLPPETLLRRGELYYNQHVEQIRKVMTEAGANDAAVAAVCHDYAGVLSGTCTFAADAVQMQDALKALRPAVAFNIDRAGLYFGVLLNYSRFLLRFSDYVVAVKNENATEETKRAYISGFYPAMDARAVDWLLFNGYMAPSDFSGFDPAEMRQFFDSIDTVSKLADYTLYYVVARLALVATPDELDGLTPPPHVDGLRIDNQEIPFSLFCEYLVNDTVDALQKYAAQFAEAAIAEAPTEQEQEQARRAATDWHDDANAQPVKIHQNYGLVLSRPVNVSPHGSTIIETKSVQRYIDDFRATHPKYGLITQMTVQKVFEGVNLLPQYLVRTMTRRDNGLLVFNTNISEFAEICGYADANQDEKQALLGGLLLLSDLYFVLDKPKRYAERVNAKGKTVRYYEGGRVAVRFLNVPRIGLDTGELKIEVYPESLKGRPTFLTVDTYKKLRAEAKGLTQSRFNAQIESKAHKSELDLIDEVFGFADMLKYATPEDLPKVTKYVQGHRGRERKRVLGWFAQYVEAGILTDFKREPSKTRRGDFVLSWVCPDPSKLTPAPYVDALTPIDEQ